MASMCKFSSGFFNIPPYVNPGKKEAVAVWVNSVPWMFSIKQKDLPGNTLEETEILFL